MITALYKCFYLLTYLLTSLWQWQQHYWTAAAAATGGSAGSMNRGAYL